MTELKPLTNELYVAGQIAAEDFDQIKANGITKIIVNRPDNEDPGQPSVAEITEIAESHGIEVVFNPLVSGQLSPEHIEQQAEALQNSTGKTLAYCRSGMRSTTLWALAEKSQYDKDVIIQKAADAGYDLSPMHAILN